MRLRGFGKIRAPEFPPQLVWLNSAPLTMKALRGKPVLIDIWTYSCVNCVHMLPHVKRWHDTYSAFGLTVIGVHSPEFVFEKDVENVRRALAFYDLPYSVVLDNEYALWNAYANRYWPHLFLIDAAGFIVYDHVGEGGITETELAIQNVLLAQGAKGLPSIPPDGTEGAGKCYRTTPETYLGYLRGHIGNVHDKLPDTEEIYDDQGVHDEGVPYLHGHWNITAEYAEHTRSLAVGTEYVLLMYSAFRVNMVMGSADGMEKIITLTLDGKPIPQTMAGADCVIDDDGVTHVHVREHRMYTLIHADHYHSGTLRVFARESGVQLFAYTFGGCKL
jgi:thiol-disulfide isomerase/thioredoxin